MNAHSISVIIVEDEPFIAMDIKDVAEGLGLDVQKVYHKPEDVLLHKSHFDLAILDINLSSHLSGIDLAKTLKENFSCEHLFITSYFDETTLQKAGDTQPLAYITKPFEERDLVSNLLLARNKLQRTQSNGEKPVPPKSIFLKSSKSLFKIEPAEVELIQAYDIYAKVITSENKWIASQSLKQLESVFEPYGFLRIHKSYMVNLEKIQMIQDDEVYIGTHRIPIGRAYKPRLIDSIRVI